MYEWARPHSNPRCSRVSCFIIRAACLVHVVYMSFGEYAAHFCWVCSRCGNSRSGSVDVGTFSRVCYLSKVAMLIYISTRRFEPSGSSISSTPLVSFTLTLLFSSCPLLPCPEHGCRSREAVFYEYLCGGMLVWSHWGSGRQVEEVRGQWAEKHKDHLLSPH